MKNDGTPLGLRGENRFGVGVSVMLSMCRLYNAVRSRFDSLDYSIKYDRHLLPQYRGSCSSCFACAATKSARPKLHSQNNLSEGGDLDPDKLRNYSRVQLPDQRILSKVYLVGT